MSKALSTRTLHALLVITQGDIQSVEHKISSAKVKPGMPIKSFD